MDMKRLGRRRKEKYSHSMDRLDQAWLLRSRTSGMAGLILHPILLRQLLLSHLIHLALYPRSQLLDNWH